MDNPRNEVHRDTDEARGGSTSGVVRWVLGISLLAAIVLLSAIWIFGAASSDTEAPTQEARQMEAQGGSGTDSIVNDGAAEFQTAPTAAADGTPGTGN